MNVITSPTTRLLIFGIASGPQGPTITPDKPRLALYEYGRTPYSDQPFNALGFAAHNEADLEVLSGLDKRYPTPPGRWGSSGRYRTTLEGIHTLLAELGWTLTDDEQALIDALEAYGQQSTIAA